MLMHAGTRFIETDRLILRRFSHDDTLSMIKNWIADERIQSLYSEPVYETVEAVTALLDRYITNYEKSDYYRWAIIEKESEECIGQIAYFLVDTKNHFAEIEYCVGHSFQGKGLATEATRAVIEFGFKDMNLNKVQICHKAKNTPSKRVIEKCGLKYEGTLRDFFHSDGEYIDRLYYSILKREYDNSIVG